MEDIYHWTDWISLAWNIFLLILLLDFLAWGIWAMSGQVPMNGSYFGMITGFIVGLFK